MLQSKSSSSRNSYLLLHLIVFLWGFTAIIGKLISLDSLHIVWLRMPIAALGLLVMSKQIFSERIPPKKMLKILATGLVVALHWILFFEAVKVSNVSVTLGCMATGTLFAAFLSPIFNKTKISGLEVGLGVIIMAALYLIFQFEFKYKLGILFAVISAGLAALFTILNEKFIKDTNAYAITFYEMLAGFAGISIYSLLVRNAEGSLKFFDFFIIPSGIDIIYMLILGLVCTAFAFAASVEIMKKISAYAVVLTVNLEPVYGIIMAFFIFGEDEKMTPAFYIGAVIILAAVIIYPLIKQRRQSMI